MEINIEILESLIPQNCLILGNKELVFTGMQTIQESSDSDIIWIKPSIPDIDRIINSTIATGIICNRTSYELYKGDRSNKLFIISEDPQSVFVSLVKYISGKLYTKEYPLIHPTAIIHPDCVIGENVEIGAYSSIGKCCIGAHTIIHDYVKIHDNVQIGHHCRVREFCSIGGAGFGYSKNSDHQNEHIPHIGSVVIEDHVELFPYSNVDRGTLGKTWIKSGTVIDHYVHIGHNTTTGKNNIIAAGTIMAGGSRIEDNCFIGVHTVIKDKCEIGSNVMTGMGSVVVKNIPSDEIWVGNPAKFLKSNLPTGSE